MAASPIGMGSITAEIEIRFLLCFQILFIKLICSELDSLTVGEHEPDLLLSRREGITAMHSIAQVTRAQSSSQTDGDIQCCAFPRERERERKMDCYFET